MFFHNDSDDDGLFPKGFEHMLPVHINRNVEKWTMFQNDDFKGIVLMSTWFFLVIYFEIR